MHLSDHIGVEGSVQESERFSSAADITTSVNYSTMGVGREGVEGIDDNWECPGVSDKKYFVMAILRHVSWLKSIGMLKVDSPVCLVWLGEVMFEFIENN